MTYYESQANTPEERATSVMLSMITEGEPYVLLTMSDLDEEDQKLSSNPDPEASKIVVRPGNGLNNVHQVRAMLEKALELLPSE